VQRARPSTGFSRARERAWRLGALAATQEPGAKAPWLAHVSELVRPMAKQGDASVLVKAIKPSYLFLAAKTARLEVRTLGATFFFPNL
jgi:hypothetical protein